MKLAFVSNNQKNIVGAFGSVKYFRVVSIDEKGKIVDEEIREAGKSKATGNIPNIDNQFSNKSFSLNVFDKSKSKHMKLAETISDCNVVIARAMCANAWDSIKKFKMEPIITSNKEVELTISEYLKGTLINNTSEIGVE